MEVLHPHERAALGDRLKHAIDDAILASHQRGHSWRLGPSSLEDECDRKIWYGFRWVKRDTRTAQMHRLLDHGKLMEPRFEEWLAAAGVTVYSIDPTAPETRKNRQYRIRAVGDHVGGFLDGIAMLPESFGYPYPLVLELKTSNDKNFAGFRKAGASVATVKPAHKKQAGLYGWKYGFRYSLYMALDKDNDDLHVEIVDNDYNGASMDELRLSTIIQSAKPPARISENATDFRCKMCRHQAICHVGADYERNCRSCDYASPIAGGEWQCNLVTQTIPRDVVAIGCSQYHPVAR